MKNVISTFLVILLASLAFAWVDLIVWSRAEASDHVDGPITIDNRMADLSDLFTFPAPDKPGHLVVALDVYPFVPYNGHFSDRVTYSVVIKPATMTGMGKLAGFQVADTTFRFDCTFETPHDNAPHWANCTTPSGATIRTQVDDENGGEAGGVRAFAGRRADPFLFNSGWFIKVTKEGIIPPARASNNISNLSALCIVLDIDVARVLGGMEAGSLFAVAGETSTQDAPDEPVRRIDRVGRPEISNARLVAHNQEEDLRNLYNQEKTFDITPASFELFKQRLLKNIGYYDGLDGIQDWLPGWDSTLANILLHDYLVVDVAMPFTVQSYFDLENSMLRSQPHTRPGGRVPGDHIINTLFTTMINGGHGHEIADGIPTDGRPGLDHFPYLGQPSNGLYPALKTWLARRGAVELAQE